MNVLKSVETTIASLVEGTFGRFFRSEVRPVELARRLAREMDAHRTTSVSRVYAPNQYSVWLSPQDRARYDGVEEEVIDELCAYLLEHARQEDLVLASAPLISFHTDERLALGEFGIQVELVRPPAQTGGAHVSDAIAERPQREHGETMIHSNAARVRDPLEEAQALRPRQPAPAALILAGSRLPLPAAGATIGRSRACDIILADAGISRRHAEIRPGAEGWTIADLGSTNGVMVNGTDARGRQLLRPGDRIELGSTELVFELG